MEKEENISDKLKSYDERLALFFCSKLDSLPKQNPCERFGFKL